MVVRRTPEEVAAAKSDARADKEQIIKLYTGQCGPKRSIHYIADAYNIHHTWLSEWLKEWGVDGIHPGPRSAVSNHH